MDTQRIADEFDIRNLVDRYSDAVVRRDAKAWGDTWAEDGEWQILGNTICGRDEIVEKWLKFMGGLPFVFQQSSGGIIEFKDNGATGRWYVSEYGFPAGSPGMLTLGVYLDRYVQKDETWLFQSRTFNPLYMGPPNLSAPPLPFPDLN